MHHRPDYDPMVSSLIIQPESFFDFDDTKKLLSSAIEDNGKFTYIKNILTELHQL